MRDFTTSYMDEAVFQTAQTASGIADDLRPLFESGMIDTLVGTGFSGGLVVPMVASMLSTPQRPCNFVLVRKDGDDSHHNGKVLGRLGERWVFVDDFVSGGTTRARVIERIWQAQNDGDSNRAFWGGDPLQRAAFVGQYTYSTARSDRGFADLEKCRETYGWNLVADQWLV